LVMMILPEIVLLITAVILLILDSMSESVDVPTLGKLALLGIVGAFASTFTLLGPAMESLQIFDGLYAIDPLAVFFKQFFLVTLFIVLAMSFGPARTMRIGAPESFILPLFTAIGMMLLASAVDLMVVFVSLELVTISFYVLVALRRQNTLGLEAGVKYLIMGALSTGFLVYGMAFVFGLTGTTQLSGLVNFLNSDPTAGLPMMLAMVLILSGIGFKLASVPFHIWAPDVYQGAPTPVTAFLSVGSKAAGVIVLLRIFFFSGFSHPSMIPTVAALLAVMAGLSVLLGNFAALTQRNVKRLLGYSSIGHAGFILMGLCCTAVDGVSGEIYFSERGVQAVLVYLVIYLLSALLGFYILSQHEEEIGGVDLKSFSGLAQRAPVLAFGMLVSFISLAGIPPLAGFLGKLGIFAAVWSSGNFGLLIVGILAAVAGLYYYLSVIRVMYWNAPRIEMRAIRVGGGSTLLIGVLSAALLILGFWPAPIEMILSPILSPETVILGQSLLP